MYDIVSDIVNHEWISNYSGDQQYIYYICAVSICVLTAVFIDVIRDIFSGFFRG